MSRKSLTKSCKWTANKEEGTGCTQSNSILCTQPLSLARPPPVTSLADSCQCLSYEAIALESLMSQSLVNKIKRFQKRQNISLNRSLFLEAASKVNSNLILKNGFCQILFCEFAASSQCQQISTEIKMHCLTLCWVGNDFHV